MSNSSSFRPKYNQDLPPQGGYPKIKFTRNIPTKPISMALVGGTLTFLSLIGGYNIARMWRERRELKREKSYARLYMLPLLQSEMDREWMVWRQEELKKEAEIMKSVEGWTVGESPYETRKFHFPAYDLEGNPVKPPIIKWIDNGEPL
ncbi:hypothetical protein MP638_002692 [Amoeboaphelidium occidentale]|nr:hypothetical protein MP638_002692 [Amoeboaphelidium occidentale]